MDKISIGFNAGIVWRLMNNNRVFSFESLKKESRLNDRELAAAIGWLAREDKIVIEEDVMTGEEKFLQNFNTYL